MRFIEDRGSSFVTQTAAGEEDFVPRGNYFAWGILIVVLLGLNIGSWVFCNMVFGHPEHPFSYGLLTKIEKLEPLEGFSETTVPGGEFLSTKEFYAKAYPFSRAQLRAYNGMLKRNYLWNYSEDEPAYFIYGKFVIEEVRVLGDEDLFPRGLIVRGEAERFPDGKVELVLPTAEPVDNNDQFKVGETLDIGRSNMAAAVIQVKRNDEDSLTFLAVPLATKSAGGGNRDYKTPSGEVLDLQTPSWLNIN